MVHKRPFCLIIFLLTLVSAASEGASAAETGCLDLYGLKYSTWANNPGNYGRERFEDGTLQLVVGIGNEDDWGFGLVGARMMFPAQIEIKAEWSGDFTQVDHNAFTGIIADYHTADGYSKRVAFPMGLTSPKRDDRIPSWGKPGAPDQVVQPEKLRNGIILLDLQAYAPQGWDGLVWFSALIENTGRGTQLQVVIENVVNKTDESEQSGFDEPAYQSIPWKLVRLEGRKLAVTKLDEAEQIALDKFLENLPVDLGSGAEAKTLVRAEKKAPLLLVGRVNDLKRYLGGDWKRLRNQLATGTTRQQAQNYVIKYYPRKDLLVAAALDRLGLIYAISHLERTLVYQPHAAIALELNEMVERPELEERGIYINIGYGLSNGKITPDNWDETQWEDFVDQLILSRVTFWSFYLWTEMEHIFPDTNNPVVEKNRRVHRMLKHAIEYSQRRGLRVSFLFTPTTLPAEMVERRPQWASQLEYPINGGICSRIADAYEMAKIVHRHQMNYFRSADEFQIAFYDPGGCMCPQCRLGQVQMEQLLKQIKDFSSITWELNPNARFGFWTWAVWRYERMHGYSLQTRLFPEIARILEGYRDRVVIVDSYYGDRGAVPYFDEARKQGFRTQHFIYQTNIEDGYVFLLPLLDFTQKWISTVQQNRLNECFLMIMEVASKYPMAHFAAEFMWDASLAKDRVAGRYALQLCGDPAAAEQLQRGFLTLDRLTYRGANGLDHYEQEASRMRISFEQALAGSPKERQKALSWLVTMAEGYEVLFQAVQPRSKRDMEKIHALKEEFVALTREDPLFEYFGVHHADQFFDRMVGWLASGFELLHF